MKADEIPLPAKKDDKQYVYLVAKSDSGALKFQKEASVLLSRKSRVVYIQTDKPIYTPTQTGMYLVCRNHVASLRTKSHSVKLNVPVQICCIKE